MIKATIVPVEGQPLLTKLEDEKGRAVCINAGFAKDPELMNPPQLVQAGLAGCMSMTVRHILTQMGIAFKDVVVTVDLATGDGKSTFTVNIDVDSDADPALIAEAKAKAIGGCYVKGILTSEITVDAK